MESLYFPVVVQTRPQGGCDPVLPSALDVHMIKFHLELGQLWRCPVEWCTVWKGLVSDCLGHMQDKHGGLQYVVLKNIAKFFPPWTVPRDLWRTALRPDVSGIAVNARLFHEAGCRLVHKYASTRTHFPIRHSGGGGGCLLGCCLRGPGYGHRPAHAAAHFHPYVGSAPGQVPE